jgi:hypothetical protein
MHELSAHIIRTQLKNKYSRQHAVMFDLTVSMLQTASGNIKCRPAVAHLVRYLQQSDPEQILTNRKMHFSCILAADYFLDKSHPLHARNLYESALRYEARSTLSKSMFLGQSRLQSQEGLACSLWDLGLYEEASLSFGTLLQKSSRSFATNKPLRLACQYNIAAIATDMGHFRDAEIMYLKIQQGQSPGSAYFMETQECLALVKQFQGKYKFALDSLNAVLQWKLLLFGESDDRTLRCQRLVALAQRDTGDYIGARVTAEKVHETVHRGPKQSNMSELQILSTVSLAVAIIHVAESQKANRDIELRKAEELIIGAIRSLGFESVEALMDEANSRPLLVTLLEIMANVHEHLDLVRSEHEYTLVVELRQKLNFGQEHPDVLQAQRSLARVWGLIGSLNKAAELFSKVVAGFKRTLGDDHPETLVSQHDWAEFLSRQDPEGAVVVLEGVCEAWARTQADHLERGQPSQELLERLRSLQNESRK